MKVLINKEECSLLRLLIELTILSVFTWSINPMYLEFYSVEVCDEPFLFEPRRGNLYYFQLDKGMFYNFAI